MVVESTSILVFFVLSARTARRGNTRIKTPIPRVLANLIATLGHTLHLQKKHVLFVRQVNIKTGMVKHLVKVVLRGNTTTEREQLHLLCAKFVRKVSGKTIYTSQIVKVV